MPSARERQPSSGTARGLRIGQSRGSEKHAGVERREAYWSAAARDCGKAREKNHSHERDACVLPEYQQGTMEESTERTRWIPCAGAVRSARAAIAPTHTLSTASNGKRARAHLEVSVSPCAVPFARLTILELLEAGVPFCN